MKLTKVLHAIASHGINNQYFNFKVKPIHIAVLDFVS